MTNKSKTKDVGWMYYTPNKREDQEAVQYPPASQIPGLGGANEQPPPEERKIWIKESDSPYIKLAKQGGRQDLLAFRENQPKPHAKDYPRCEWFYQEDNSLQDELQDDAPYIFKLPEYMVHKQSRSDMDSSGEARAVQFAPSRLPYALDSSSVYDRDGRTCTDKTVGIPNDRPVGYGVRQEKMKNSPEPHMKQPAPPKPCKSRRPQGPDLGGEEGPTNMNKLMAGTYEREWHDRCEEWHVKHPGKSPGAGGKLSTEYKDAYEKMVAEQAKAKAAAASQGANRQRDERREARQIDREIEKMEKEMFKLSRFKNVNAKVDHHRAQQRPSSTQRCLYEPSQSDAPKRTSVFA